MPWSFLLKVMLAAFIPGLLTYPVILLGFSLGSTLILGAINYAVLYLVIGFNLNIFKRSDVMFVYNKITRIWYHFKAY
jgi:hypothetical protein